MSLKCCLQDILAQLVAGIKVTNTCDDPVMVEPCGPIEVVVVDAPSSEPLPQIDVEFVCNETTGFYDMVTVTTTDGVAGEPVTMPTDVSCVDGPAAPVVTIDVEYLCNTVTGVYDEYVTTTTDGIPAAPVVTPTDIACTAPDVQVSVDHVCNADTGVYDQVTVTTTDGVQSEPVVAPTDISCAPPPVVTVDVEYVCDDDSGLWNQATVTTTDGVPGEAVITPTTISCADDTPVVTVDVEYVCNADSGVYDEYSTTTVNGVPGVAVVTPTDVSCAPAPVVTVDVEYVCNADTELFDQVTVTTTDGVAVTSTEATTYSCALPPVVEVDVEYLCDDTTGFYNQVSTVTTDGVTAEPVVTVTTLSCEASEPEFQMIRECRDDTIWVVLYTIAPDGTRTEVNATDTGETCGNQCQPGETWCTRTDSHWIDNQTNPDRPQGISLYPQSNWTLTATCSDGAVVTIPHPATGGGTWGTNLQQLAAELTAATGVTYAFDVGAGDDNDTSTPFVGHVRATLCPGDKYVASVVAVRDGDGLTFQLASGYDVGTVEQVQRCQCCGEAATWFDAAGGTIEQPACLSKTCEFPEYTAPADACPNESFGPFCYVEPGDDLDITVEDIVRSDVFMLVDCNGLIVYAAPNGDDLEPFDPSEGLIVDCDTLAPVGEPVKKPDGDTVKTEDFCIDVCVAVIDNNAGIPASTQPIYRFNATIDFATTLVDGTVINWSQQPTAGWTQQINAWVDPSIPTSFAAQYAAVKPGCTVQADCFPVGCGGLPGVIQPVIDAGLNAYARHMNIVCCDEGDLPATTEVLAISGGTAPVGHVQNNQPTCVELKVTEVTVCDPDTGAIDSYVIDAAGDLIDPRTLPPKDCWGPCPDALTEKFCSLVGPSQCPAGDGGGLGDCDECVITPRQFDPDVGRGRDSITANPDGTYTVNGGTTQGIMTMLLHPDSTHPCAGSDFTIFHVIVDGASNQAPGDTGWLMIHPDQVVSVTGAYGANSSIVWNPTILLSSKCSAEALSAAITAEQGSPFFDAGSAAALVNGGNIDTNGAGVLPASGQFYLNGYAWGTGAQGDVDTADHYPGNKFGRCYTIDDTACGDEEPEAPQVLFTEDACVVSKLCEVVDAINGLTVEQQQTNELLAELAGCVCCTESPLDRQCSSYSNPLSSGYDNWGDTGDLDDLADEFGCTPTTSELWVRIVEFDCGGATQPQVGQIFGPYTPGPNGPDQFITDLSAAVNGTCLVPSVGAGTGPNGAGSTIDYSFDSTQDATLVIQEGVTSGAGVCWFTSAQGIVVRDGEAGDFISSDGNGATTSYAGQGTDDLPSYAPAQDCVEL